MDIKIAYSQNTKLTNDEIKTIIEASNQYGNVQVKQWETRGGAIDIVTYLEITVINFALSSILSSFV